jgi:hypothetical protein
MVSGMSKLVWIGVALAAVACGSKSDDSSSGTATATSAAVDSCDAVAGAVDRMIAKRKDAGDAMSPEMKARADAARRNMEAVAGSLKQVLLNACKRDHWPAEVTACYGTASTQMEMAACRKKLPEAQAMQVQREIMTVMMSSAGRGGSQPMAPPPPAQ